MPRSTYTRRQSWAIAQGVQEENERNRPDLKQELFDQWHEKRLDLSQLFLFSHM